MSVIIVSGGENFFLHLLGKAEAAATVFGVDVIDKPIVVEHEFLMNLASAAQAFICVLPSGIFSITLLDSGGEIRVQHHVQEPGHGGGDVQPVQPGQKIRAYPGAGQEVPLWLLGSSLYSAQLATDLEGGARFGHGVAAGGSEQGDELPEAADRRRSGRRQHVVGIQGPQAAQDRVGQWRERIPQLR